MKSSKGRNNLYDGSGKHRIVVDAPGSRLWRAITSFELLSKLSDSIKAETAEPQVCILQSLKNV